MKALIATGSRTMPEVGDIQTPDPGPGEVAVRVELAGVNFADVMALRGDHGYAERKRYVPGLEVVGTVERRGPGVEGLPIGQRVTAYVPGGGFAEIALVATNMLVSLPENVDSRAAVCVPVSLSTAHLLLEDVARVRANDRLLIHSAAGGMGLAIAGLMKQHDSVQLIGTVGSKDKLATAIDGGYGQAFVRDNDLVPAVHEATAGRGVTIILGALGTERLADDIEMAAPGGRIIRFGNAPGSPQSSLPKLADLSASNVSIAGFSRRALARRDPSRVVASFEAMVKALANDTVSLTVTEVAGLRALPGLLSEMATGRTSGKFVVRIGDSR